MLIFPRKTKFQKPFVRKKFLNFTKPEKKINIGNYLLVAGENGKISNFQIEALRKFLRRFLKKKAQIFIPIFTQLPVTKLAQEVRLGRGKGSVKYWQSNIKKGEFIIELRGCENSYTKTILKKAKKKLALNCFIFNRKDRWIF